MHGFFSFKKCTLAQLFIFIAVAHPPSSIPRVTKQREYKQLPVANTLRFSLQTRFPENKNKESKMKRESECKIILTSFVNFQ